MLEDSKFNINNTYGANKWDLQSVIYLMNSKIVSVADTESLKVLEIDIFAL